VKVGSAVGVAVSGGPAGADDGGADDGGTVAVAVGVADGLLGVVGLAVGVGEVVGVAVEVGAAVPVGAGAGGPKQPASAKRAQTPRTLNAETPGLVMMPPRIRALDLPDPLPTYAGAVPRNRDLSPA
jgi:hypothetical protein